MVLMITIDFSNPAQMACLSFAVALVTGISFIGGIVVGDGKQEGVIDFIPFIPLASIFIGMASLLYHLVILILQHL